MSNDLSQTGISNTGKPTVNNQAGDPQADGLLKEALQKIQDIATLHIQKAFDTWNQQVNHEQILNPVQIDENHSLQNLYKLLSKYTGSSITKEREDSINKFLENITNDAQNANIENTYSSLDFNDILSLWGSPSLVNSGNKNNTDKANPSEKPAQKPEQKPTVKPPSGGPNDPPSVNPPSSKKPNDPPSIKPPSGGPNDPPIVDPPSSGGPNDPPSGGGGIQSSNKGDLTHDGKLDKDDLKKLIEFMKKPDALSPDYDIADMNDDGDINKDDVILLKKRIKGPISMDLNYDGKVDEIDRSIIEDYIKKIGLFTQAEFDAVDLNHDKKIDQKDLDILDKRFEIKVKGDVSGDGKLDDEDLKLMENTLKGKYIMTDAEKDAANLDNVGGFTSTDLSKFKKRLEARKMGDVNNDGKLDKGDLNIMLEVDENHLLTQAEKDAADINHDGHFDEKDTILLSKRFDGLKAGDIDGDDKLTTKDLDRLKEIIDGDELLTNVEKKIFDFNNDGKITMDDYTILSKRFDPRQKMDLNNDGVFDGKDTDILFKYLNQDYLLTDAEMEAADVATRVDKDTVIAGPDGKVEGGDLYWMEKILEDAQKKDK